MNITFTYISVYELGFTDNGHQSQTTYVVENRPIYFPGRSMPTLLNPTRSIFKYFFSLIAIYLLITVLALTNKVLALGGEGVTGMIDALMQQSSVVRAFDDNYLENPDCFGMIHVGDQILANIHTAAHGCELHRLDDVGGTQLLADINPGPMGYTSLKDEYGRDEFGLFPTLAGWYYFEADDGVHGNELWRTDGFNVVPAGTGNDWGERVAEISRGILNGRLYVSVSLGTGSHRLYSADSLGMTPEANFLFDGSTDTRIIGTFHDKLLIRGSEDQFGLEPWVFDGMENELLSDLNEGPDDSLVQLTNYVNFNDSWLFEAVKFDSQDNEVNAFTKTDGAEVEDVSHSGSWRSEFNEAITESVIRARDAEYLVQSVYSPMASPPPQLVSTRVVRVTDESSSAYQLGDVFGFYNEFSVAVLNDDALALRENRLFLLGESAAEELELTIPSDWESSDYEFVGSSLYFDKAYIKESNQDGNSRVWGWNQEQASLLMADEVNVVTSADHFRHIGNDIYFYGEDDVNGRALRKISDVVVKPVPRLGAVTGSWYDPVTSGQGFVLHAVDDSRTVFSFFGFEDDSSPLWLTGVSEDPLETAHSTEFTMYINSGGDFGSFYPDQISEEEWGTMKITFDTCSKAVAELAGLSGQQTLNLVRLARLEGMECDQKVPPKPASAGITGSWFDPATSGQGLVLHSINDEQLVVSFYGYKDNSERLWLIGAYSGQVQMGESLVIDMVFTAGGSFGGFNTEDITEHTWGTLSIEFENCNNATATLDGIDGRQTMNITKLAGLQGSEINCY